MSTRKGITALILVTIFWGTTFPVIKSLMRYISPSTYATLRSILAALILLPFILHGRRKRLLNVLKAGFVLGFLYFSGLFLQAWGMVYTEASSAAFITSFNVPLVCVLEILILKRRPSLRLIISMILAVAGVMLLTVNFKNLSISKGDFLVLACTIFWAFQVIFIDMYSKTYDVLVLTFLQLLLSGLLGLVITPILGQISPLGKNALLLLGYLAIFCSSLTCFLQIYGQQFTTSTQAAIIYALEPVFASFFSYILLHEILTPLRYIGASFVIIATILASTSSATLITSKERNT